jgi:signal transduction histidine kinase
VSASTVLALGSRGTPALGSIRFRIAILTAGALVLIAGIAVGALQLAISAAVDGQRPLSELTRPALVAGEDGRLQRVETIAVADVRDIERAANAQMLRTVRNLLLVSLGGLFAVSLGVAWLVSGRVLRPIERISALAGRIEATTLSQRLALEGHDHELKRLADAFDGMLARLESAFALQRRYIAEVSHELRNPLAVIRTNLDVALAEQHAPADVLRSHAGVALRATDRMSGVVSDLLAVARLETPGSRAREVDLGKTATEVADELEALAAVRGLGLERRLAAGLRVVGDHDALRRALVNLLDNAIRLAPDDSRIELTGVRSNGWVEISVTDEGPGLEPDELAHVFERFWRSDRTRPGSGLGLALVKQVAEAHGGHASVRAAPGGGSTFELALPAVG